MTVWCTRAADIHGGERGAFEGLIIEYPVHVVYTVGSDVGGERPITFETDRRVIHIYINI